jgi:hypothetical protein
VIDGGWLSVTQSAGVAEMSNEDRADAVLFREVFPELALMPDDVLADRIRIFRSREDAMRCLDFATLRDEVDMDFIPDSDDGSL